MKTMKETMLSILEKSEQTNFIVISNDKPIGNIIGINVGNKYIEVINSDVELVSGYCLSTANKKLVVDRIEKNDNNYRIYFSDIS